MGKMKEILIEVFSCNITGYLEIRQSFDFIHTLIGYFRFNELIVIDTAMCKGESFFCFEAVN